MRITPLDVRKQDFRKAVRGFDCDEVRAFLSTLADEYETVLVDNKQIREMVMEQEDKIQEYQGMERNLRDTLMTAERVMQETRENASKKGDLIVKDAEMKAQRVLEECRLRTEELRREIAVLRKEKETYLARFKSLAQSQIQFVETHQSDFEDLDKRLTSIVDSVVATAGHSRRVTDKEPAKSSGMVSGGMASSGVASSGVGSSGVEAPAAPVLDPFAAANRIEGDPSAPRDLPVPGDESLDDGIDRLEVAVPAVELENDVWRDYTPVSRDEGDEAGSISELVSESLAETSDDSPSAGDENPAEDVSPEKPIHIADGPVMTKFEEPVPVGSSRDTI